MSDILDPNKPEMFNINGQDVDISHGLVTPNGKPLRSKKGDKLNDNLKKRQVQISKHKDNVISEYMQEVLAKVIPEKKMNGVKSEADAKKLLDKMGIGVLRQDHEKYTYLVIMKSQWRKPPQLIVQHRWKWK